MPKPAPKNLVIIAGEASGDIHAAALVRKLKACNENLDISGIGGQHMQNAGVTLISDLARFGVTGILEVLRHIKTIKRAYRAIQAHLKATKPDLLILVDYPGFNLRLAEYAKKKLGLTILYYVSPQLWAWKPGRIKRIQASVDHMAVIFPFEKKIYETANVPVSFVGHPLTKTLQTNQANAPTRKTLGLPENKRILAILPGSRINEIERHMPVLYQTAIQLQKHHPDLAFVIPIAGTLTLKQIKPFWISNKVPCTFIEGKKATDVARISDAIVVASGTASLECALLEKPMCIIYKLGFISYLAASALVKIQYAGLCNLLTNRMTVPELLQYDFNPGELTKVLSQLLDTTPNPLQKAIKTGLSSLKQSLSAEQADCSLSDLVLSMLEREKNLRSCQRMA
ncbi:MAG: lipid-A-disaccharide synthase [Gammaproteobacteria bacterium]|nr:lipid-A-disaccharide synthase [Gammaproteobacteria bacterium]